MDVNVEVFKELFERAQVPVEDGVEVTVRYCGEGQRAYYSVYASKRRRGLLRRLVRN